ncbi:hypothetical protein BH20ACT5_BH20ACT5_06710 [soil metagenome]
MATVSTPPSVDGTSPQRAGVSFPGRARIGARTLRTDRWWLQPLVTFGVLAVFIAYTGVRIFMRDHYYIGEFNYLTPLFSPCLSESCVPGSSHLGTPLPELPVLIPLPFLIFPILAGFRATCYYYRKAYYRAFWLSPPACAVAEPHAKYTGETRFPLVFQNLHRFFFYAASMLLLINSYDAVLAFFPDGGFGVGLGSLILVVNVTLLWGYSLSCHSCRHLTGGRLKHFSKHPVRYKVWTVVSKLNGRHMQFAWLSLVSVMVTDFYIVAISNGWLSDLRFIN